MGIKCVLISAKSSLIQYVVILMYKYTFILVGSFIDQILLQLHTDILFFSCFKLNNSIFIIC